MRRFDKIKTIHKANLLTEERYLESRELINESTLNSPKDNHYVVKDLLSIGNNKPLGYLPLDTITKDEFGGYEGIVKDIISWSDSKKYEHILCSEDECSVSSGALYIYDPISLKNILTEYKDILVNAGIPTTPNEYVTYIKKNTVYERKWPEAYVVIGLTYGDSRFK